MARLRRATYTVANDKGTITLLRFPTIALLLTVPLLSGCAKEYSDADIVLLNVHEADLLMGTQESSLFGEAKQNAFVDPRTVEKYATGHIPGAISLPYRQIAEDWENLQEYGIVVVYGNSYNDPLAEAMSKTLMEYGISEVKTLRGGLEAWINAGQPITKGRKP